MQRETIFYVPAEYVEAVGWATIGWAQLEMAADVVLALATEVLEGAGELPRSFEARVNRLKALSDEKGLRGDWRIELGLLVDVLVHLREDLNNAAQGTLYGRGLDNVSFDMRMLYEKTHPSPVMSRMTKASVEKLATDLARQTRRTMALAMTMAEALALAEGAKSARDS